MVCYYEYQTNELLERGIDPETPKPQLDAQLLGTIMYNFMNYLQVEEVERLHARNVKLKENPLGSLMDRALGQKSRPKGGKRRAGDSSDDDDEGDDQVPIGFDYSENFPALPDFDGKGKKMRDAAERRQRLQQAGGHLYHQQSSEGHNFNTNHAREIRPLNDVKARYKQLSHTVIQDLYDVFRDVSMIDDILKMTFPMFNDASATGAGKLGTMLTNQNMRADRS